MPFIGDHYPRIDDNLSMDVIGTDPKIESGNFEQAVRYVCMYFNVLTCICMPAQCHEVDVIFRKSSKKHHRSVHSANSGLQ